MDQLGNLHSALRFRADGHEEGEYVSEEDPQYQRALLMAGLNPRMSLFLSISVSQDNIDLIILQ